MQNGSLSREQRKRSSDVWCYRWWESGPTGRRIHRRIILGTVEQLHDKRAANQATVGLRREINSHDIRTKTTLMTVAELADHFRQRELLDSNMRITYSTKKAYAGLSFAKSLSPYIKRISSCLAQALRWDCLPDRFAGVCSDFYGQLVEMARARRKLLLVLAVFGKRGNGGFVWDSRPGCAIFLLGRHSKEAQRPAS